MSHSPAPADEHDDECALCVDECATVATIAADDAHPPCAYCGRHHVESEVAR